jgi:hypothetical protein
MVFGLMAASGAILALTVSTRRPPAAPAGPPAEDRVELQISAAPVSSQPLEAAVAGAVAGLEACQRAATEPLKALEGPHELHLRLGPGGLEGAALSPPAAGAAWPPGFVGCAGAAVSAAGWPAHAGAGLRAPFYVVAPLRERGAEAPR